MRAICAGSTTKHDVVHQNLEQYREVYVRTTAQIHHLKAVSADEPPRVHTPGSQSTIVFWLSIRPREANSKARQAMRKYVLGQQQ